MSIVVISCQDELPIQPYNICIAKISINCDQAKCLVSLIYFSGQKYNNIFVFVLLVSYVTKRVTSHVFDVIVCVDPQI